MEKEKNGAESENSVTSGQDQRTAAEETPVINLTEDTAKEDVTSQGVSGTEKVSAPKQQEAAKEPESALPDPETDSDVQGTVPDSVEAAEATESDTAKAVEEPTLESTLEVETATQNTAEDASEPAVAEPIEKVETTALEETVELAELPTPPPVEEALIVEVQNTESAQGDAAKEEATTKAVTDAPAEQALKSTPSVQGDEVKEVTSTEANASPKSTAEVEEVASTGNSTEASKDETPVGAEDVEVEIKKANEIAEGHPIQKHVDDDHHDEFQDTDFTKLSQEELVEVIKKLGKDENPLRADRVLSKIAPLFNEKRKQQKAEALKAFIASGGEAAEFEYKPDELSLRFDANYRLIKDRRSSFVKDRERQKQSNLGLAEVVLDKLRDFMDSEESSVSFEGFKALQNEWKAIGDVPAQQSRTLWANYNALIHRFYDQRSIYFELKELDRKKNYDAKIKLCERAEALDNEPQIKEAIKQLNDLHYDFKHLGPVPRALQEDLWQRFKAASDKIYEKRKGYVAELKTELNENLVKKEALAEEISQYVNFTSDQIKEWNSKSKEVLDIQKRWDAIGGLPKDKAKAINKKFWSGFKSFFHGKKLFFKDLEKVREENLALKEALVAKAIELSASEDWQKTANEFKKLQQDWKLIGPVPGKVRNEVYERFKTVCDGFFDKKRSSSKEAEVDYADNLKKKRAIIDQIAVLADKKDFEEAEIKKLTDEFHALGFVPKKDISKVKEDFRSVVEQALKGNEVISEDKRDALAIQLVIGEALKGEQGDKFLYQKEQNIRRQINSLENEIALWTNNLEFFRHSKSADKLRDEFNSKIEKAQADVDQMKRKLKAYRKL